MDTTNPERTATRDHGYPIIAAKASRNGGRIIVADRGADRTFHRYAVWHEHPNGACEGGDYLSALSEASRALAMRA